LIELAARATLTVATAAGVTVIVALPLFPSLVAVMLAVPTAIPVTTPEGETVATAVLLEFQVIDRPVRIALLESNVVAVACDVPTAVIEVGRSETVTDATGTGVTVIADVPLFPSLVAVMVAVPSAPAVTSPLTSTVAIVTSLDVQATTRPVKTLLAASRVTAVSCVVEPTTTPAVLGVTATDATGTGVTVSVALPLWVSLMAVMCAVPGVIDVTSPVLETVATAMLSELQAIVRPVTTSPLPSSVVAVACVV
jgi:hypothetical protein